MEYTTCAGCGKNCSETLVSADGSEASWFATCKGVFEFDFEIRDGNTSLCHFSDSEIYPELWSLFDMYCSDCFLHLCPITRKLK
jgi:hypothetical protein